MVDTINPEPIYPIIEKCLADKSDPHEEVDCGFIKVLVKRDVAEENKPALRAFCDAWDGESKWGPVPPLTKGPSYIHLGAALGSQQTAIAFMAIGKVLGFWDIVTPKTIGILDDEKASSMMGMGFVMISGYEGETPNVQ